MAVPPSTLISGDTSVAEVGRAQGGEEMAALMIAWSAAEPERVGEVALFEVGGGARILGRGRAAQHDGGGERVIFHRQRPGLLERTAPLASPGISREQLRIRPAGAGLFVERIGKCPVETRGERVDRCELSPGDTLLLKGQMLLFCTRRPLRVGEDAPELRDRRSPHALPAFGDPDALGIVGESPAAWRLRDRLAWIAQADEHTLLLGASGSGKELCARAVHALSRRARGAFVARNAATIPHGLADAELFGNMKGYPNPGMPARPGLIGAADGGTLFLDEIGELPHGLQANLLRVLDEGGEYHGLGGSTVKRSDFRLLCATNRDPSSLKHDLEARLVLRFEVPGLDERRDDIPLLARHLLRRAAAKSPEATRRFLRPTSGPAPELRVTPRLIAQLLATRYTTHIRELEALLWRAMSSSTGDAIDWLEDQGTGRGPPTSRPERDPRDPHVARAEEEQDKETVPPEEASDAASATGPSEREVRAQLAAHKGNIVRTANALGLSSRYVLYRLMRRYRIDG